MTQNKIISIEIMIDTVGSSLMYSPISEVIGKIQKIKGVICTKNQRIVSEKEAISFLSSNQVLTKNGENTQ